MEPLIEVKNLKKYFPVRTGAISFATQYVKAVDDISFEIGKGETFGLVGESGCGKTTVGNLILRLTSADSGQILINGKDILSLNSKDMFEHRRNMQMIFQDPYGSLNPRMTVGDLIREPILCHKLMGRKQARERVVELLEMVGMNSEDMRKYPHEFSGGQRQRIVIARALSLNPSLLVCDEPVSALDVSVQAQVLNLLSDLQKQFNISYLFIAHGMPVVKHISKRVGVMYMGKLVEVSSSSEIFENCLHPYTHALMSAVPIPEPHHKKTRVLLGGEVPSPIDVPLGCRFHPRCAYCTERCKKETPELKMVAPDHMLACHLGLEAPFKAKLEV